MVLVFWISLVSVPLLRAAWDWAEAEWTEMSEGDRKLGVDLAGTGGGDRTGTGIARTRSQSPSGWVCRSAGVPPACPSAAGTAALPGEITMRNPL
jgi:hypothetical protein